MHAVLLAGGEGTRLRPFTHHVPKVLLPVDGVPVIELLIAQLKRQGVHSCTVVTGHLAEIVQNHLRTGERLGVAIDYLRETKPLDTAGCLGQLTPPSEPFLLVNADVITDLRFGDLVQFHHRLGAAATVATHCHKVKIDFGVVEFDAQDRMTGYIEKPTHEHWVSMGVYCLDPRVCGLVSPGERISMPELLLRVRAAGHVVGCYREECYWRDIGRPEDYAQAEKEAAKFREQVAARQAA